MVSPHVLFINEKSNNLAILKKSLKELDCQLTIANKGKDVSALLESHPDRFDLIIMDQMLSNKNNINVLDQISAHSAEQHCPVIIQTEMVKKSAVLEGVKAGAYFLTNPVNDDMLISTINTAINYRQQYKLLQSGLDKLARPLKNLHYAEFQFNTLLEARDLALFIANACPDTQKIIIGLSEILINAVEHGNLGITYYEKTLLIKEGRWEKEVNDRIQLEEHKDKKVDLTFHRDETGCHIIVKDQGNGFDWQDYLTISPDRIAHSHGRGIALAAMAGFTKMEYRGCGNEVYIFLEV
ncbi:MAG: response regulator [Gammaproteobacteria bacterium]|nr:response regulator [Gammaproteobacteria bacterium]MDH5591987.1 response regulator [Gammaproteobacteria bacterium]